MLKTDLKRRDLVLIWDLTYGIGNGDPDNSGAPRMDPDTGLGLWSPESIKHMIRVGIDTLKSGEPGFDIYIRRGNLLNDEVREGYAEAGIIVDRTVDPKKVKKGQQDEPVKDKEFRVTADLAAKGNARLAQKFWDVRAFGAVINGVGQGRLMGPLQFGMGETVEILRSMVSKNTRCATENAQQDKEQKGARQNWFSRELVPFAVYRMVSSFNPFLATKTGFSEADFQTLLNAFKIMFELNRSATRGFSTLQQVVIFEHADPLGNSRSADLVKLVKIGRRNPDMPAKSFDDYIVTIDHKNVPEGIEVKTLYPEVKELKAA